MTSKPLRNNKNVNPQGATLLGPGDFPLGSPQSRAAARLRLQLVGAGGAPAIDCICFPEEEQPSFGFAIEMEIASKVRCPLHSSGFTPVPQLYLAKRFRQQVWKDLWTRHSDQYRKAWFARFPQEIWPAEEEENERGEILLRLKNGERLLAFKPAWGRSDSVNDKTLIACAQTVGLVPTGGIQAR